MRLCVSLLLLLCSSAASAQFPGKTVTLVVPYAVGGPSDLGARGVQPVWQKLFNRPVIVENISGAGGAIGAARIIGVKDGNQILFASPNEVILAPLSNASVKYRSEDFRLLGVVGDLPYVLVGRADLAPNDLDEVIAYMRNPANKTLNYGSVGVGSLNHLAGEDFKAQTGADMNHVAFKGAAPLVQDLLGGHLDLAFTPMAGSVPGLIESKKLKFYGMTTAARSEKLKHLATVNEGRTLRNFVYSIWVGPVVPRPTPEDAAQRIHAALNDAMKEPEVRKAVESAGFVEMAPLSLAGADRMFQAEVAKFRKIAQMIKLEPQ